MMRGRKTLSSYAELVSGRSFIGVTVALLLCASPAGAQKKVERKIPLGMEGALAHRQHVGSVVVHGWNKDTVMVRGTLGAGANFFMGAIPWPPKMFVEATMIATQAHSARSVGPSRSGCG